MNSLQFAHMQDANAFSNLSDAQISFNLAGDNVLISGISGKKIYVYRIFLVVGGITNLIFKDGLSINKSGAIPMLANGSITLDISNVPWFQTTAGNDFILNSSQSVQISGVVYYQQN